MRFPQNSVKKLIHRQSLNYTINGSSWHYKHHWHIISNHYTVRSVSWYWSTCNVVHNSPALFKVYRMLGLTRPSDQQVVTGFELVTRT
jgi:hypothetical protein